MELTRRIFAKQAAGAVGGLALAAFVPRAAFAGCTSRTQLFNFVNSPATGQPQVTIPDWKLGDCELKNAALHISGNFVILNAQVATHHTHTHDVWHMTVDVFTRDNQNPSKIIVLATGKFDGPQMSEQDHPLFHQWDARFQFNADVIKGKRIGARVNSCC